jgi:hypothetical protein
LKEKENKDKIEEIGFEVAAANIPHKKREEKSSEITIFSWSDGKDIKIAAEEMQKEAERIQEAKEYELIEEQEKEE